jgi:hypothetical protein
VIGGGQLHKNKNKKEKKKKKNRKVAVISTTLKSIITVVDHLPRRTKSGEPEPPHSLLFYVSFVLTVGKYF